MRLIDADWLLDVVENIIDWDTERDRNRIIHQVRELTPTVEALPHWIPCSERLPEVKQKVLVQYVDESMATKRCNDEGHLQWFYANAVAWMPAPEPYKEVAE